MKDCCAAELSSVAAAPAEFKCPRDGSKGEEVKSLTVRAHLKKEYKSLVRDEAFYRFCASPNCDVVYFDETGWTAPKEYLAVRVGMKEKEDPIPVCYCYGYSREDIRREVQAAGTTTIPRKIRAKVKAGRCQCETKNPSGSCCLGEVAKATKEAQAELSRKPWSREKWERTALLLVVSTLAYNIAEAVIALWSGAMAESIALFGFGLDSVIETLAALALLWRISLEVRGGALERIAQAEHRVRQIVGVTFLALALYVLLQAGLTLWNRDAPQASPAGIALASASLIIMPLVSWGKLRAAKEIGSRALRAEAKETLACAYLSFTLLLGLAANALKGWWWMDPAAALTMIPWLVKEGREGLSGEECCN